jgi:hypothetical protein
METYCHTRAMHFSFHLLSTEIKKVHNEKYSFQFFSYTPPLSFQLFMQTMLNENHCFDSEFMFQVL